MSEVLRFLLSKFNK